MDDAAHSDALEQLLGEWRSHVRRRPASQADEVARWEEQLRAEVAGLRAAGLAVDEAFLVALKRLGSRDSLMQEFARGQFDRLGKQFGATARKAGARSGAAGTEGIVAFGLAVMAAASIKAPALFGLDLERDANFYLSNAGLLVLPWLTGYFSWKRRLAGRTIGWLAAAFVVGAAFANLPGFGRASDFAPLTALHLPIALLLTVGVAYSGGRWGESSVRMDFIRFSGELFIYYVLLALGGGVLCAFTAMIFKSIGINIGPFFGQWLLPCGAAGAVVVASWLVEAKQSVMENMAPLLTRLFTPLFAAMLVAFLGTVLWSRRGIALEREMLIGFDLLLVVVLGLLVYTISARPAPAPPGAFDVLQVILVICALLADAVALWAIGTRIGAFGFSPNRVAALGENLILLINLAGSAVLYLRFLLRRGSFESLERWQTGYLPVYAAWAAFVVILFPPLFRWFG